MSVLRRIPKAVLGIIVLAVIVAPSLLAYIFSHIFGARGLLPLLLILLLLACPTELLFELIRGALGVIKMVSRTTACRLRGHDFRNEVVRLKVVEIPKELPPGPPTTAYRQPAVDEAPLALVVSTHRYCRRCQKDVVAPAKQD